MLLAPVLLYAFHYQRFVFDFGYSPTAPPVLSTLLATAGVQLGLEFGGEPRVRLCVCVVGVMCDVGVMRCVCVCACVCVCVCVVCVLCVLLLIPTCIVGPPGSQPPGGMIVVG